MRLNHVSSTIENIIQNSGIVDENEIIIDGIVHCTLCKTHRELFVPFFGQNRKVRCICKCQSEKLKQDEFDRLEKERLERISKLRANGIHDKSYRQMTFANDDNSNKKISNTARKYVEKFKESKEQNIGLYLYGDTGNGKSYTAAMIANSLIDNGYPVLMTSFARIESMASSSHNKVEFIDSLNQFDLLIIDDLGAERQSDYMLEYVFTIIDNRCKAKLPVIITSNISFDEIKNPPEMKYKRIYDRITEMCVPIFFDGQSKRRVQHDKKKEDLREILLRGE
jgi:DNA replication protein DnaC